MLDQLRYRLRALLRRDTLDRELNDELAFHIECETDRLMRDGVPADEARRRARVAIGGLENTKELHRDRRGTRWIDETIADVRYAARGLARDPAVAAAAVITLALAIGANAAMFSAVDAVLLQPLPFAHPDRLVEVGENNPEFRWHMQDAAGANVLDWRARVHAFSDITGYAGFAQPATLLNDGTPTLIMTRQVMGNFFSVLGIAPQAGRLFTYDETWSAGANLVVISDRLWRARFAASRAIVGKSISIDGKALTVIGVAPSGLDFPDGGTELWRSVAWPRDQLARLSFRRAHWLRVVARLAPAATMEQASAELAAVAAELKTEYPATNRVMDAELVPLHRFLVGDTRLSLLVLLASVGLLLLIACANVGNLLLVRAAAREREVAVRVALGAGRSRLMRQALVESLFLAVIGGALGLALGWWGTRTLGELVPRGMLRIESFGIDWAVASYVLAITTACGLLFGIAPAVWASRRDPSDALKSGGRAIGQGARAHRWGQRLAVAEIAIALLLAVGAGLLIRSYSLLQRVDPGLDPRNVITATLSLPGMRYDNGAKVVAFYDQLVARVRALPSVSSAGVTSYLSLTLPGWSSDFSIEGPSAGHFSTPLLHREVSADYFTTMRVPLVRGRVFTAADRGSPPVVVINEAFARSHFAGRNPIGQRITFDRVPDSSSTWRTIVGVVGSEHQSSAAMPADIEAFEPPAQQPSSTMTLVARTASDPTALGPAIRHTVAELDPQLAITQLRSMSEVQAVSMARDRFLMLLLSLFGLVGLVLAVVGVYGVVAQLARGRTREMGIRVALGASAASVRWLIVRHGLMLAAAGLAIGGVAALAATHALARLLFGVAPTDPLTFGIAALALVLSSLLASWLPGRKAALVDPVTTLRDD